MSNHEVLNLLNNFLWSWSSSTTEHKLMSDHEVYKLLNRKHCLILKFLTHWTRKFCLTMNFKIPWLAKLCLPTKSINYWIHWNRCTSIIHPEFSGPSNSINFHPVFLITLPIFSKKNISLQVGLVYYPWRVSPLFFHPWGVKFALVSSLVSSNICPITAKTFHRYLDQKRDEKWLWISWGVSAPVETIRGLDCRYKSWIYGIRFVREENEKRGGGGGGWKSGISRKIVGRKFKRGW